MAVVAYPATQMAVVQDRTTKIASYSQSSSGSGAAPPTQGQIWPRGSKGSS